MALFRICGKRDTKDTMRLLLAFLVVSLGITSAVVLFSTLELTDAEVVAEEDEYEISYELTDGRITVPQQIDG